MSQLMAGRMAGPTRVGYHHLWSSSGPHKVDITLASANQSSAGPQRRRIRGPQAWELIIFSPPACRFLVSGIFDLEPIRLNYLNERLGLDAAEARRNSPLFAST